MPPLIDLDTIQYPSVNPTLVLSVSDAPFDEVLHVNATQYLYVEKYSLAKYLSAEVPAGQHGHTRFHLFTHELALQDSESPLGFGVSGSNGTAASVKGGSGGEIVLAVEDTSLLDTKRLSDFKLDVSGGAGYSPPHVPGRPTGDPGGDGGNGGHVQIWLRQITQKEQDATFTKMRELLDTIHTSLKGAKTKNLKWPGDFKEDENFMKCLAGLVMLSKDSSIVKVYKLEWVSPNAALAVDEKDFKRTIVEMHVLFKSATLTPDDDKKLQLLEKSVVWQRGSYGKGSRGDSEDGKNGKVGLDGQVFANWLTVSEILKAKTCFAHPTQCQMLLDKAKVFYYFGSPTSTARSDLILQKLETRLLFLGGAQDNIVGSTLAHEYESAEQRLFVHADPPVENENDPDWKKKQKREPAAVRLLRAVRDEASRMRQQMHLGLEFYGPDGDTIPNLSIYSYQGYLKEFMDHAAMTEESYSKYQIALDDTDKKLAALRLATDATAKRRSTNEYYYQNARGIVEENATKIEDLTEPLEKARGLLAGEVESIQKLIKDAFSVSLKDAVSAIGQVLFTSGPALPIMFGLQAADICEDASTKIENDLGEKLKKSYVIKQIKSFTGETLKGLFEQYTTKADGDLVLKDGDTTKLVMAENHLDNLIDSVSEKLNGDTTGCRVKERFDKYIALIKERNNAVLQYNSALALMRKSDKNRSTIDAADQGISKELQDTRSKNPQLVLFMKTLYTDALTDTQFMLNRAQKALNFEFLGKFNVFDQISDYSSSRCNAALLNAANEDLLKEYIRLKNEHRPRQPFTGIKYPLDEIDVAGLEPSPSGNIKFLVDVKRESGGPFEGKADVRLTKVRFFAQGATTDSELLNVTLTHETTETIYDERGVPHKFSHPKQIVSFSHHTKTLAIGNSDGTIGEKREKDGYALVGPFSSWWIDIRKSNNKGLAGEITSAWFEFDGEARAVVAS